MKLQKTTSVTVFGILNIVFAVFGIFGVIGTVMVFAAVGDTSKNPVIRLVHDSPAYALWLEASIPLGLLAAGALLAAGIGLLNCRRWARTLSIIYAIYSLVMVPINLVVSFFLMVLPLLHQAQGKTGPEAAGAIGGASGGTWADPIARPRFGAKPRFGARPRFGPVQLLSFRLRAKPAEPVAGQA